MAGSDSDARAAWSIMVIDDDRLLLEHLEMTLKDSGYNVVTVEDGEAALYLAPTMPLDLIILDSVMPGMGGPEVLRHLKGDKTTAGIPVSPVVAYAVGMTPAATVRGATPARTKNNTAGTPSRSAASACDTLAGPRRA